MLARKVKIGFPYSWEGSTVRNWILIAFVAVFFAIGCGEGMREGASEHSIENKEDSRTSSSRVVEQTGGRNPIKFRDVRRVVEREPPIPTRGKAGTGLQLRVAEEEAANISNEQFILLRDKNLENRLAAIGKLAQKGPESVSALIDAANNGDI